ncbi:hypothetical protein M758_2G248200 [Ceratodon purpureus]|nr:hypothetical protein M758_2G248200 [Ceratodon purpureus]KAG0628080.1 hypothetical protein M758_2G248200 [Ceratodon purpureus]
MALAKQVIYKSRMSCLALGTIHLAPLQMETLPWRLRCMKTQSKTSALFNSELQLLSPQIQYISTAKGDGSDDRCEQLGWKRLQHYSPSSEAWQLLDHQAALAEDSISAEIPLTDDLYFPGQPFASLLACCKVGGLSLMCMGR